MFNGYGLGGATKDIKLTPEEVEKLKSNLIEWDGEFYPKIVGEWKNPEDLYKLAINQQIEIERLNNIINEIEKCIDYYAIENDDFSKFYNNEEIEILKIIGSDKE